MHLYITQPNQQFPLATLILFIGVISAGIMTACDPGHDPTTLQAATAVPQTTSINAPGPTRTPYPPSAESKAQAETQVAQNRAQWATELVLTPIWTPGPPPPTETAKPEPTWEMG